VLKGVLNAESSNGLLIYFLIVLLSSYKVNEF